MASKTGNDAADDGRGLGVLLQEPSSGLHYRLRDTRARSSAPVAARLILLHGVGSSEYSLSPIAADTDSRVQVLLLRGPLRTAPNQYGWFQVSFMTGTPAIDAHQAENSRKQLITLVQALRKRDGARPAPTILAGFGQGGVLSASVGLSMPTEVAGFAMMSGRILPELEPHIAPRAALSGLPAFVAHGRFDDKLPIEWATRTERRLTALDIAHQIEHYPIGHELTQDVIADFQRWLEQVLPLSASTPAPPSSVPHAGLFPKALDS